MALDELHGIVVDVVLNADAEDRHDVSVVQPGHGAGLALEALQLRPADQAVVRQHLECDMPAERLLHRLVDDAHAAAADLAQDAVLPQLARDWDAVPRRGGVRAAGRLTGHGAKFLHHDQGWKQIANLLRQLRVAVGVLSQGRVLALAVALGELVGQVVQQVGSGLGFGHDQGSMVVVAEFVRIRTAPQPNSHEFGYSKPGKLVRISLSRLRART